MTDRDALKWVIAMPEIRSHSFRVEVNSGDERIRQGQHCLPPILNRSVRIELGGEVSDLGEVPSENQPAVTAAISIIRAHEFEWYGQIGGKVLSSVCQFCKDDVVVGIDRSAELPDVNYKVPLATVTFRYLCRSRTWLISSSL